MKFLELKNYAPIDYEASELEGEEEPLYVAARVVLSMPPEHLAVTPQSYVIVDTDAKTYIQREILGELVLDGSEFTIPKAIMDALSGLRLDEALTVLMDRKMPRKLYENNIVFDTPENLVNYLLTNTSPVTTCKCLNVNEEDIPLTLLSVHERYLRIAKLLGDAKPWVCDEGPAIKVRGACFRL